MTARASKSAISRTAEAPVRSDTVRVAATVSAAPISRLQQYQQAFGNQALQRSLLAAGSTKPRLQRKCAACSKQSDEKPGLIQTKLTVNEPGDAFEREADRVADAVMRMPAPPTANATASLRESTSPNKVQRACSCGGSCKDCQEKAAVVQRVPSGYAAGVGAAPPIVHEVLRSSARPLDAATRSFMEPRFGADFSRVRVHTDAKAAESAKAVNALAYTVGSDVVFGTGQFTSASDAGRRILSHELVHVVQQGAAPKGVHMPDGRGVQSSAPAIQRITRGAEPGSLQRAFSCDTFTYPGSAAGVSTAPGRTCVDDQGITGLTATPPNLFEHFGEGGSALSVAHLTQIKTLQSSLSPTDTVEIHGYASCDGAPDFNLNLSCDRAEAVGSALTSAGATPFTGSVSTFAHGETNEFGASLDANRRAIVKVTHAAPVPPPPPPPVAATCLAPPNPDESGSAFNPTTSGQTAVVLSHPIDAITANSCADDAFAAAGASGLAGPHLGPQDAFRHCFWACCMAKAFGASEAEEFGTAHENSGPSSIPFDNQQDLHDNSIGRGLAGPTVDCDADCKAALSAGRLRTIRGPSVTAATGSVSPVATDCIGASNQPWP